MLDGNLFWNKLHQAPASKGRKKDLLKNLKTLKRFKDIFFASCVRWDTLQYHAFNSMKYLKQHRKFYMLDDDIFILRKIRCALRKEISFWWSVFIKVIEC